jgi:hypothetical protein
MIAEAWDTEGIGFPKIVGKMDAVDKRPAGIGGMSGGKIEDSPQPPGAAGADDEHAKAIGVGAVLEDVVPPDLTLPGIRVLVGAHPFGTIVEFHEVIELSSVAAVQFEDGVGIQDLSVHGERAGVLAIEPRQYDTAAMGSDQCMDEEFRQAVRVVVAGDGHFREMPP